MRNLVSMFKKRILLKKNVHNLNMEERFAMIYSIVQDRNVIAYLKNRLANLTIQICGESKKNVMDLMNQGLLEGWCWQSTSSSIVFLDDDDYIERGNLKFSSHIDYWHSWICFNFRNKEFVFDPCLRIVIEKNIYHHVFETSVEGRATAKEVKEELIRQIINSKQGCNPKIENDVFTELLRQIVSKEVVEEQEKRTYINSNDDVHSPMYRNNAGYNAIIEGGKIKELFAHFPLNG